MKYLAHYLLFRFNSFREGIIYNMKIFLTKQIETILCMGIKEEYDYAQKHEIRHTNIGGIVAFLFAILSTIATSVFIPYPYVFIPLMGSFSYLAAIPLNYYYLHKLANANAWFISVIMFFWMANAYGEASNAYLLFIIAEMMSILNFDKKGLWIYFTLVLPIIFSIITYLSNFSLFLIPNLQVEQVSGIHGILFFSVLFGCAVMVWVQRRQVQEKIDLLEEKYKEVEYANKELHKTNEELDRFVYSVSHDLRAPITSVMGLVDLCTSDRENIDMYLVLQRKSMNKLDNFIKDILHYARNSRLEVVPVPLDLSRIIKECFESQCHAQSAENIDLQVNIVGDVVIYNDDFRFNIILGNIISNAIRYCNPKANPSYIHFRVDLQVDSVKITITDNGLGIPAQHLPHIFKMFYRANAKISGSGLGLYIVKEALTKMQGQIAVESEEGKGTMFTINIPNIQPETV